MARASLALFQSLHLVLQRLHFHHEIPQRPILAIRGPMPRPAETPSVESRQQFFGGDYLAIRITERQLNAPDDVVCTGCRDYE
jgi:hypothetical protein